MKLPLIGQSETFARAAERTRACSSASRRADKNLDWQRVIDHIAAEIWIVIVRLDALVCSPRARQQRITARLRRCNPVVFPAAPGVPVYRVQEIALNPRRASIEADPDLGNIGASRPGGAQDGVGPIGFEPLIDPGA